MQNLEKWYRWTYLQGRNRDTEAENGCMDIAGGETWDELGIGTDMYTLPRVSHMASGDLL